MVLARLEWNGDGESGKGDGVAQNASAVLPRTSLSHACAELYFIIVVAAEAFCLEVATTP